MICWACQSNVGELLDRCPYCGAVVEVEADDPMVGRQLGVYQLLRRIGQGGMGVVYEAYHIHLQVSYALKLLHPSMSQDWVMVERLRREAVVAFQLQHENIVRVLDYGWDEQLGFYLVMELLHGEGLNTLLVRQPVLPLLRVAQIVYQICAALDVAHYNSVVHRDLKPANVFLTRDLEDREQIKLLDFGIARLSDPSGKHELTRAGRSFGTPAYMPPEQILSRSAEICPATDIYALAGMVYRMLTGVLAFKGNGLVDTLNQVMVRPTPLISQIRAGLRDTYLEHLLVRCMDKQIRNRVQTAKEFSEEFRKAIERDPLIRDFLRHDEAEKMVVQHEGVVAIETVALDYENLGGQDCGVDQGETFIFAGETFQFNGKELVVAAPASQQTWGRHPGKPVISYAQDASQVETLSLNPGRVEADWLQQEIPTMLLGVEKPSEQLRESIAQLAHEKLANQDSTYINKLHRPPGREYTPPGQQWMQGSIPKPSTPPKQTKRDVHRPQQTPMPPHLHTEEPFVASTPATRHASLRWIGLRVVGGFLVGFLLIGVGLWGIQWMRARQGVANPNHEWTNNTGSGSRQNTTGLKSEYYYLTVESTPSQAHIIEQGKLLGTTPLTIRRRAGEALNFVVEKRGYELSAGSWSARHDRRMMFELRLSATPSRP